MPYVWLGVAVFLLLGGGFGGYRIANNACKAAEADRLIKVETARKVDESFTLGVSAGYEQVAAELRRITGVKTREVIRETQKVEYRCPLPESGLRVVNRFADDANRMRGVSSGAADGSAASQSDNEMRSAPQGSSPGFGGAASGVFGTDGDIR